LDAAASVTFDGVPALSVYLDPNASSTVPTVLVVVTPPHAEGFVDMVVTNPDGQSATFHGFHYGPPPSISSLTPATNVRKGDLVTMTGANFGDIYGVQVSVGGQPAKIISKSPTEIVFAVPKQNAGTYQVFVFNWDSQYAVSPVLLSYRP
jgi:IPT/TIG domain-containing protein